MMKSDFSQGAQQKAGSNSCTFWQRNYIWILKKKNREKAFHCKWLSKVTGCLERWRCPWRVSKLTGKYPKQPDPTLMSALLWGDGTKWPSEVSSNLNWTVIHYQFFKCLSLKSTEISSMENKLLLSNFNHLKNRFGNLKNVKLNHSVIYRAWCLLLVKSVIARNH